MLASLYYGGAVVDGSRTKPWGPQVYALEVSAGFLRRLQDSALLPGPSNERVLFPGVGHYTAPATNCGVRLSQRNPLQYGELAGACLKRQETGE
jgi:hypothetical protein